MTKRIRVFPRHTNATPYDDGVRIGPPTLFDLVHPPSRVDVSVVFTWDIPAAERLAKTWEAICNDVKLGGPAFGERGGEFIPGKYLRQGYVITSRGCPNNCWFCSVWRREGREIRELPITDGWNILDDNLLACSDSHIRNVFSMLKRVKSSIRRVEFTGGLEAARLKDWHIEALRELRPKQLFFAYDTPDDLEPLRDAGRRLLDAGFSRPSKSLRAYVLIGWPGDTMDSAHDRLKETVNAGFVPMAMLYRDHRGHTSHEWRKFQRDWARPALLKVS